MPCSNNVRVEIKALVNRAFYNWSMFTKNVCKTLIIIHEAIYLPCSWFQMSIWSLHHLTPKVLVVKVKEDEDVTPLQGQSRHCHGEQKEVTVEFLDAVETFYSLLSGNLQGTICYFSKHSCKQQDIYNVYSMYSFTCTVLHIQLYADTVQHSLYTQKKQSAKFHM